MPKASILLDLIEHLELNISKFEKEIKAGNGSIGKLIAKDKDISRNLANKITLRYPNINIEWLETGEGEITARLTKQQQKARNELKQRIKDIKAHITVLAAQIREIERMV